MGDDLLPANPFGNAHRFRASAMGFQPVTQVGRCVGEVADPLSDRAFLRSHVVLRGFLCAAALRHRALHTGRKPDGDNGERADYGRLPAKLVLLGRLSDGCEHRGIEVPEPCAGLGGMDDSGGRHGLLYPKLRRGRGAAGQDDGYGRDGRYHAIRQENNTIIKF